MIKGYVIGHYPRPSTTVPPRLPNFNGARVAVHHEGYVYLRNPSRDEWRHVQSIASQPMPPAEVKVSTHPKGWVYSRYVCPQYSEPGDGQNKEVPTSPDPASIDDLAHESDSNLPASNLVGGYPTVISPTRIHSTGRSSAFGREPTILELMEMDPYKLAVYYATRVIRLLLQRSPSTQLR